MVVLTAEEMEVTEKALFIKMVDIAPSGR